MSDDEKIADCLRIAQANVVHATVMHDVRQLDVADLIRAHFAIDDALKLAVSYEGHP